MGMIQLHKMARTTPAIRKEIREAILPERDLARKYNITRETVRKKKWYNHQIPQKALGRYRHSKSAGT